MSTISLEYMAGLFDGEGTVTLLKCDPSPYRQVVVSIQMCDKSLVEEIKNSYGGATTYRKARKANYSDAWTWKLTHRKAMDFLASILPYVRLPAKRQRISYILDNYDAVFKANGKYTEQEKTQRLIFEEAFFSLTPTRMSPIFASSSFEELVIT